MSTTRANWKKHKAKQASFARQSPEQLAARQSKERARLLRKHYEAGAIGSISALVARAEADESKELRGSVSHEALRIVLEARAAKAGGHE